MKISYLNRHEEREYTYGGLQAVNNHSIFPTYFLKLDNTNELLTPREASDKQVIIEKTEPWETTDYKIWQKKYKNEVFRSQNNQCNNGPKSCCEIQ